jgi:hypothetical protein
MSHGGVPYIRDDWGYSDPLSPFGRENPQPLFWIMDIYWYEKSCKINRVRFN